MRKSYNKSDRSSSGSRSNRPSRNTRGADSDRPSSDRRPKRESSERREDRPKRVSVDKHRHPTDRPRRDEGPSKDRRDDRPRRTSSSDDRPRRSSSSDDRPRRSFSEDRPRRSSSSDDRPRRTSSSDDRPRRSSSSEDRPRRSSSSDDRPRRTSSSDDRPRRSAGVDDHRHTTDRPRRSSSSEDRPRRSSSSDDRPRRTSSSDDRPRRSSSSEDRPRRSSSSDDRPRRTSSSDDRPRRSAGVDDHRHTTDRPRRTSSSEDRPRRSSSSEDRPRREYSDRPRRDDDNNDRRSDRSSSDRGGRRERGDLNAEFVPKKAYISKTEREGLIRLNRFMSNAGIASRREADQLIELGLVTVNGQVVKELGTKVDPNKDVVKYDDRTLRPEKLRYVLLNKPKGYLTTMDDPEGRRTVMELIVGACPERIYPVGRLDRATTGLLLFTNDGELAKRLMHPKHEYPKLYYVETEQKVRPEHLDEMRAGFSLDDGYIKADEVEYAENGEKKQVGIRIHSGRNRIVRRMFEHFGYTVVKLDRVMFAGLTKRDLPRGHYRELTENEINFLRMIR